MDIFGFIEGLIPTIVATTTVVAFLKGWVAKAYRYLTAQTGKMPRWVTRVVALLVAILYASVMGDEGALPEITDGTVSAIVAGFLTWAQARVGSEDSS